MSDSSIKRIDADAASEGDMGQKYLASGKRVALRLWEEEPGEDKTPRSRPYETVGYVISGKAKLTVSGDTITLAKGDSWVVPEGAEHSYDIQESFTAVEATSPPARVDGRDDD